MLMSAEDADKFTVDDLEKVLSAMSIVGEPIEMEDKIIIPIAKMGMGFGAKIGPGIKDTVQGGIPGGAGGGAGVFPVAVLIIFKGVTGPKGIKVVPLEAFGPLSNPMADIAHILLDKLKGIRD
jgi:uncharacterized spore protein YtfJ